VIPKQWKLAHDMPIYRKGAKTLSSNYRLIADFATLYTLFIGPTLEYANGIWDNCCAESSEILERKKSDGSCTDRYGPIRKNSSR
jgi:hypothetical protein